MDKKKNIFIFGYGYTAAALVRNLLKEGGWEIAATSRNPIKRKELQRLGINAFDFPDSRINTELSHYTHLLISVPPTKQGDSVLAEYRNTIQSQPWEWIGFLSTTGVYGDQQGNWVDETISITKTPSVRLQHRLDAEFAWLNLYEQNFLPVHIFRLAGIYGPGRGIGARGEINKEQVIYKEGHYFSRIHVADIAGALQASMAKPNAGRIYNLCDNCPAPRHEVAIYRAQLLGLPSPELVTLEQAQPEGMLSELWQSNRRVSNRRLREELAYSLLYPDYKAGLKAIYQPFMAEVE